jgi:hypothetical protein
VTRLTNSVIAVRAAPTFQDGSGSPSAGAVVASKAAAKPHKVRVKNRMVKVSSVGRGAHESKKGREVALPPLSFRSQAPSGAGQCAPEIDTFSIT